MFKIDAGKGNPLPGFLYNENHAIVAWLKRGLPMSLEKKTPIV